MMDYRETFAMMSSRLPGNLQGQNPAGLAVGIYAIFALGLSAIGLIGAVELRITEGQWWGFNDDDPLLEAGSSLGFYAAMFMMANFILATRWGWVQKVFGGIVNVYRLHAFSGKVALTLILLHPGLIVLQALPDWSLVGDYILPGRDLAYTLGVIGTLSLLLLVAATIWIDLPYARWLRSHKLMIVPFLAGILHSIVLEPDWYMVLTAVVGTYAWVYTTFVFPKKGTPAQVMSTERFGNVRELTIAPSKAFNAKPGQFVLFEHDGRRHPFSISGIGTNGEVRLSIRRSGAFTTRLDQLDVGSQVALYGPYGNFGDEMLSHSGPQIWIAGGIGITPFLGVLQHRAVMSPGSSVTLIWSVKGADHLRYQREVRERIDAMEGAGLVIHDSDKLGRLDCTDYLHGDQSQLRVFICGPSGMIEDIERQLIGASVSRHMVTSERFGFRKSN